MKTIQFFVSTLGVDEVMIDDNSKLHCTCEGFKSRKKCKHVTWCEKEFDRGTFPIQVDNATPDFEIQKAKESNEAFRDLLIRYGKIEVI